MTMLNGIDVSRYQATTPSLAGLSFLLARASIGTWPDHVYPTHIANARKAGMIVGAYHFGTAAPVAAQVATFLASAGSADQFALDLESNGGQPPMTWTQARAFIAAVKATGRKIGLYHSRSGFPSLGQDWNWVADWSQVPSIPYRFWQYRGSPLDLDHFNGTLAQLRALAGKPVPPAPPLRYHVVITGYTPLYSKPGIKVGAVRLATYTCSRSKVGGLWWYRITGPGTSKNVGRSFKPNRNTKVTYA